MDIQSSSAFEGQMLRIMKKQLFWQRLIGVLMAGVIGGIIFLAIRVAPQAAEFSQELESLAGQAQTALSELEDVSESLNELDIEGLLAHTDQMVQQGEKSFVDMSDHVSRALKNLEELDVDSFNQAIGRLNAVAGTLSSLFGGR